VQTSKIKNVLTHHKAYMHEAFGLQTIAIFGSMATGKANDQSDVDLLVELSEPNYLKFIGLQRFLESKLEMKIDLLRKGPHLTEEFLKSINNQLDYA
jgi:predicted nucleotidyltransferase